MDRCFTISHDQPNLNWKEHYNLKEQIERWILNTISGPGITLALPKLAHKKEYFRLSQKMMTLIKKACNAVIVEGVIIQIWTI